MVAKVAPQIHAQYGCTYKHHFAHDERPQQFGIHTHQKESLCGSDACASFEPRFGEGNRAPRDTMQRFVAGLRRCLCVASSSCLSPSCLFVSRPRPTSMRNKSIPKPTAG